MIQNQNILIKKISRILVKKLKITIILSHKHKIKKNQKITKLKHFDHKLLLPVLINPNNINPIKRIRLKFTFCILLDLSFTQFKISKTNQLITKYCN